MVKQRRSSQFNQGKLMRSGSIKAPKKRKNSKYNFVSWTEMEKGRDSRQIISGPT